MCLRREKSSVAVLTEERRYKQTLCNAGIDIQERVTHHRKGRCTCRNDIRTRGKIITVTCTYRVYEISDPPNEHPAPRAVTPPCHPSCNNRPLHPNARDRPTQQGILAFVNFLNSPPRFPCIIRRYCRLRRVLIRIKNRSVEIIKSYCFHPYYVSLRRILSGSPRNLALLSGPPDMLQTASD